MKKWMVVVAAGVAACASAFAADGTWIEPSATSAVWSDTGNWQGGTVAENGGIATMNFTKTVTIQNDLLAPLELSKLDVTFGTASAGYTVTIQGGTNLFTGQALITAQSPDKRGVLCLTNMFINGTDITFSGYGQIDIGAHQNLYTGRTIIGSDACLRVTADPAFGPVPSSPRTDAIVLDGGTLMNGEHSVVLDVHENRGVKLTAAGGYLSAGYNNSATKINGPITGPGSLGINPQNSPIILANSGNAYEGDTVIGALSFGAASTYPATLRLGANDVLPHGQGKGNLVMKSTDGYGAPRLDLNGFEVTVNGLTATNSAVITSSVPGQGKLTVLSPSTFRGRLENGVTLRAEDVMSMQGAQVAGGTVEVASGDITFDGMMFFPDRTLAFDGGNAVLTNMPGFYEYSGPSMAGATIDVNQPMTFTGWKATPEQLLVTATGTFPLNTQYSYQGMWNVPTAGTYSFAGFFDDGVYLKIGNDVILNINNNTATYKKDVALAAGWHTLDVRCANTGGNGGKRSDWRAGVLFSANNVDFSGGANLSQGKIFGEDNDMTASLNDISAIYGRMLMNDDGAITVNAASLGEPMFSGIVQSPGNHTLSFTDWSGPLLFGSFYEQWPAVLDGNIANSLTLTNYAWLCRIPASYTVAPGAMLAFDGVACPDASGGSLSLSTYSLQMLETTPGVSSVTVNTDTTLSFKSRVYDNGTFVEKPAAFSTAVTLNNGTVNFDTTQPMTFSGTFSGTGNINKNGTNALTLAGSASGLSGTFGLNAGSAFLSSAAALGNMDILFNGGRLCNMGNLTIGNPIWTLSGGFDVLVGTTFEVTGPILGYGGISKWGAGTLRLSGSAENTDNQIHVRAGTLELNKTSGYAVRNILGIESGTSVILTGAGGDQIADIGNVQVSGGTFDLNGHNETVSTITATSSGSVILNNGPSPATLTVGAGNASATFANGVLSDGTGSLALTKIGTGTQTLESGTLQYTGATTVDNGTLRILPNNSIKSSLFRLTLIEHRPKPDGQPDSAPPYYYNSGIQIGEFQLTYKGTGLLWAPLGQITVTGTGAGTQGPNKAVDNALGNDYKWYVNNTYALPYVLTVECNTPVVFDGYRIATGNDAHGRDPVTWTVEVGVVDGTTTNWTVIDAKTDYNMTTDNNAYTPIFPVQMLSTSSIPDGMPVVVNAGGTLSLPGFTAGQTIGGLTGSGKLALDNSIITLPNPGNFTGRVTGNGTVIFDGFAPEIAIAPMESGLTFANNGAPASIQNNSAGTNMWGGSIQDGTAPLGLTQISGTTYYTATGNAYSGDTVLSGGEAVIAGMIPARYVRFTPLVMRPGGANAGVNRYQLSRFRLMFAGQEILYPAGTTAYGELGSNPGSEQASNVLLPEDPPYNTNTNTKFYWNGGTQPNPLVIMLPYELYIDGYTYYTGNDSDGRDPVKWTVEVSIDGTTWTLVDSRDVDPSTITTIRNAKADEWQFSTVSGEYCVFSPNSQMTIHDGAKLSIIRASEPVGPLSGDGLITLGAGTLILCTFTDADFEGTVDGAGVMVKQGAATQTFSGTLSFSGDLIVEDGILNLDGAALAGVTNIILRGGVLTGNATVSGDLTITFEGGVYDANLNVSGALSVVGEALLRLPNGEALPYRKQLFTFGSADPNTLDALENALMATALDKGVNAKVRIDGGSVTLIISRGGTILILK